MTTDGFKDVGCFSLALFAMDKARASLCNPCELQRRRYCTERVSSRLLHAPDTDAGYKQYVDPMGVCPLPIADGRRKLPAGISAARWRGVMVSCERPEDLDGPDAFSVSTARTAVRRSGSNGRRTSEAGSLAQLLRWN